MKRRRKLHSKWKEAQVQFYSAVSAAIVSQHGLEEEEDAFEEWTVTTMGLGAAGPVTSPGLVGLRPRTCGSDHLSTTVLQKTSLLGQQRYLIAVQPQ